MISLVLAVILVTSALPSGGIASGINEPVEETTDFSQIWADCQVTLVDGEEQVMPFSLMRIMTNSIRWYLRFL